MSDDSKDNPPSKLTLSRDLKDQAESAKASPPPAMKLKRKVEPEKVPAPSSEEGVPSSTEDSAPEVNAAPAATTPEKKPNYDPKNPFGDVVKEGEIKKPLGPPPELPSKPAPKIDDGSGEKLEEAIGSLNTEDTPAPESGKGSLMLSITVILILLLVLGGAGYGLWKLLKPADVADGTAAVTEGASSEKSSKNPIEKAKDAIAKLPVADVDAISEAKLPGEANPSAEAPAKPAETIATVAQTAPKGSIESSKQSVSQYLSGIHIGGVRKGDRPMVLIEGTRFLVGDIIQPETGLKFDGIRDGRLAFRDSHGIVYLKSF